MNEIQKKRWRYFVKVVGEKCEACNMNDIRCFSFHHIDPNTKESKHDWKSKKKFTERIDRGEIILLCENCHRIIHYELRKGEIELDTKDNIINYLRQREPLTLTEDMNSR